MIGKAEYSSDCDRKVERYSEQASPESSISEVSSVTTAGAGSGGSDEASDYTMEDLLEKLTETGDGFWSETFPPEEWSGGSDFSADDGFWSEVFPAVEWSGGSDFSAGGSDSKLQFANLNREDNDFWRDVFNRAEELTKYI